MPGSGDEQHVGIGAPDETVQMRVHKAEPRRRPPVTEQPRLDVLRTERLSQEWVFAQVDLPDSQIVRGAPEPIKCAQIIVVDHRVPLSDGAPAFRSRRSRSSSRELVPFNPCPESPQATRSAARPGNSLGHCGARASYPDDELVGLKLVLAHIAT